MVTTGQTVESMRRVLELEREVAVLRANWPSCRPNGTESGMER